MTPVMHLECCDVRHLPESVYDLNLYSLEVRLGFGMVSCAVVEERYCEDGDFCRYTMLSVDRMAVLLEWATRERENFEDAAKEQEK